MMLKELVAHLPGAETIGSGETEFNAIECDSRRVRPGALFVAVPGFRTDGHDYVRQAVAAGAAALLVEADRRQKWTGLSVPAVAVPQTRPALAVAAAAFFGWPARRLTVIGVTGTDGKTTVVHLIAAVLEAGSYPTACLSSVEFRVRGVARPNDTHMTTLESPEIQAFLAEAVAADHRFAVVEASSHGLALHRVDQCDFDVGVFTNLAPDHLDFHRTMDGYRADKGRLFSMLDESATKGAPRAAVLNADGAASAYFRSLSRAPVITYGLSESADVRATNLRPEGLSSRYRLHMPAGEADLLLPLPGTFNVSNALAAAAVAHSQGIALPDIVRGLESFPGVPGRMERIEAGQPFTVIVDIASTAPALRNVLNVLRPTAAGRLWVVFGCAGERDPGRREGMGRVAALLADFAVLTNEDPRSEDPDRIIDTIARAMMAAGRRESEDFLRLPDRQQAIAYALQRARPGDTVLLAGKGTEQTMIFGYQHVPWDERSVARRLLQEMFPGT